jgi:tetratricopeptide (TPR) repeat protein
VVGLVCASPDAITPAVAVSGGPAAQGAFAPRQIAALLGKVGADAKQNVLLHLALAQGYAANGLDIQAAENMEAALAEMPALPLLRLHYIAGLDGSPLHSGGDKRRIRTEMLDALLAENAAMIPALVLRAQDYVRDDRWQDAADLLDRALKAAANDWRVQLARAEMFARADWEAERFDALHAARKLAPQALPVLSALSGFWSSRNSAAKQIELQREILALTPASRNALAGLSGLLLRTGNTEESMKLTRAWATLDPGSGYVQSRMAALLLAAGKLPEACAIFDALAERTARPGSDLDDAAEACFQQGDEARGAQYLQRVLETSPDAHSARRQLQRIRGESEDFWTKYAVPFEEAQKVELTRAQFPRADSALLLDESIDYFFEDGSSIAYIHQVRKILTQGGVDARGKDRVRGELVSARTVQPDGKVLEPITYGGGQIEFPGLKIGSLVDLCWVERRMSNPYRVPGGQQFYFSDNEFSEPFAISRYVVIAPRSLPLEYFQHNLKPGEFTATPEGGMVVRTWDVRRPTHPQAEAFAPSTLETIPWIECVLARGWEAKARQVADRGLGMLNGVTALIRDKAAEITAGQETDEAKARAIYAWVNEKLTTQGDASNAHQALKALAGDREDLFAALCSAAGVKFGFAAAHHAPEFREHSNTQAPGLDFAGLRGSDFDLFLFVVQGNDGAPIYLDLSARMRPFGYLGSDRSGAPLISWRDGRSEIGRLPALASGGERIENRMTIHLKADGGARVEGMVAIHGERAWGGKEALRTMPQDDQRQILQRELAGTLPGVDMEDYATPGLETPGAPLTREFKGAVAAMARKRGAGLAMGQPVTRLGQLLSVLVGTPERNAPIVISFNYRMRDEIRVVPPEGWRFKAKPEDLVYPTAPFVVSAKYALEDGVLVIRRSLDLGPGRIEPVGYQQLTKQVRTLAQNEETRLELEKVE